MTDPRFTTGQTGLIAVIPEAEPVVGTVRDRYDPHTRYGIVPHVTVLFPFLDHDQVDATVRTELGERFAGVPAFDVEFVDCARFPGWLYLAPRPDNGFRALTATVQDGWPAVLPYGGRHGEPVPHLSVAATDDDARAAELTATLCRGLPFSSRVDSVHLVRFDGKLWRPDTVFPLGAR